MTLKDMTDGLLMDAVKGFTRFHSDLVIESHETHSGLFVSIQTHADDMPKLIGSSGCMIAALRCICDAIGQVRGKSIVLDVSEPKKGSKLPQDGYRYDENYNPGLVVPLLERFSEAIWCDSVEIKMVNIGREVTAFIIDSEVPRDRNLSNALSTVVHAIGKAHGRKLYVEVDGTAVNDRRVSD